MCCRRFCLVLGPLQDECRAELLRLGMGDQTALSAQRKGGTTHSESNADSNNRDFY